MMLAIVMAVALGATTAPLQKHDYVRCLAHMEKASIARATRPGASAKQDIDGAMACTQDAQDNLTLQQKEQLIKLYSIFKVQLEVPSATGNAQVMLESSRFLQMLD